MTYIEFRDKYNGKYVDVDNYPSQWKYQCFDLVQKYITECLGLPASILAGCGNVCNMLKEPKLSLLLQYFDEVPVTNMAQGDICIFYNNHIAIQDNWDGKQNNMFSQNPNPCKVMYCPGEFRAFRKKQNTEKEKVDQYLHKGSHVQIPGTFDVIDINVKENTALVKIAGKEYWLSSVPLLEVE